MKKKLENFNNKLSRSHPINSIIYFNFENTIFFKTKFLLRFQKTLLYLI